jgi:hypothetical protein
MYHGFILSLNYHLLPSEEDSKKESRQVYIKRTNISKLIAELAQFDGKVTEDGRTVKVEDWFISEILYSSERKYDDE